MTAQRSAISFQRSAISRKRGIVKRKPRDFRKLEVWQKAHALVLDIYRASRGFPKEELFGLTSQSRRAAASMPANIAERCGRGTAGELARFMGNSMGSASELEYHLILARDLGLLRSEVAEGLIERTSEVGRMPTSYVDRLEADG